MTILTNRALRPTVGGPAGEAQVARVRRSSTTVHAPGTAHPRAVGNDPSSEEGDRKAGPVSGLVAAVWLRLPGSGLPVAWLNRKRYSTATSVDATYRCGGSSGFIVLARCTAFPFHLMATEESGHQQAPCFAVQFISGMQQFAHGIQPL